LSAIYFDILKDRIYASAPNDPGRRAAQTVLYEIMQTLVVLVAPVLTFSSEEVWQHMNKRSGMPESVQLTDWPASKPEYLDSVLQTKWDSLLEIRGEVTKALEIARRNKEIGNALDADLIIYAKGDSYNLLQQVSDELANFFIVSAVKLETEADEAPSTAFRSESLPLQVMVLPSVAEKCNRCWIHAELVRQESAETGICKRCAAVMSEMGIANEK
jgi:isoleucyl-tRNA synthetase